MQTNVYQNYGTYVDNPVLIDRSSKLMFIRTMVYLDNIK